MSHLHFDETTHTYYYDGERVPSVTGIISDLGISGQYNGSIPTVANAAIRGSAVHKILELGTEKHSKLEAMEEYLMWAEQNENVPYSEMKGYVDAGFAWLEESGAKIISTESRAGCKYYAGTVDIVAQFEDGLYVVDWKTTAQEHKYHNYQIAAYCKLLGVEKGAVVYLKKDGTYNMRKIAPEDLEIWSKLLGIYISDLPEEDKRIEAKATIHRATPIDDELVNKYLDAKRRYDEAKSDVEEYRDQIAARLKHNGRQQDGYHDALYMRWVGETVQRRLDQKKMRDFVNGLKGYELQIVENAIKAATVESKRKGHYKISVEGGKS